MTFEQLKLLNNENKLSFSKDKAFGATIKNIIEHKIYFKDIKGESDIPRVVSALKQKNCFITNISVLEYEYNHWTVHYSGSLGDFDYKPSEFYICTGDTLYLSNDKEYIRYIGNNTDCSKLQIPKGLKDCSYMFAWKNIIYPPKIPDGVIICASMFEDCKNLIKMPYIPKSVKSCKSMFYGCKSLKGVVTLPSHVVDCSYMFKYCDSITEALAIPQSVLYCRDMFHGCSSLQKVAEISINIIDGYEMFWYCESLLEAPRISDNIQNCENMFLGCTSLQKIHNIPNNCKKIKGMFANCEKLKELNIIPKTYKHYRMIFTEVHNGWLL